MKNRATEPTAQSLLEFMDIASDAVKCALKKPATFKRNVNHRRYLQRQVKTVVRSRRNTRKINPCDLRDDVQDLVREAIKELKFTHNAFGTTTQGTGLPLHSHRVPTYRLTHLPLKEQCYEKPCSYAKPEGKINPCLKPKNNSCRYNEVELSSGDDCFMTCEELTDNIDINDLYIPELHEPRSPEVKCEDYFNENLEIPSPMYDEEPQLRFQFECNLGNIEEFL